MIIRAEVSLSQLCGRVELGTRKVWLYNISDILENIFCVQIHSLLITQWCNPRRGTHTLPRRPLHSKCHVLGYTRQRIFNNVHKTSTTFPAPNSMTPISAQ